MGLDVLFNGGRAVRLFIQGCLILWFGLFSSQVFAVDTYPNEQATWDACYAHLATDSAYWKCDRGPNSGGYGYVRFWFSSNPVNFGRYPLTESCEVQEPNGCGVVTQEPEECYENGEIYDSTHQQCVQSCPEGELNGVCLEQPAANGGTCDSSSADYQGFIGNGNTKFNICESNQQCDGGSFGVVNGTPACIPDEYGPPTCSSDSTLVIDEYGFVCTSNSDAPQEQPEPEEPNTDTDGDGVPDEYDPANDPQSTDKAIDRVSEGVAETNKQIEQGNNRLDKIGKGIEKSNELQDEANGVLNDTRNTLKEIKDGMAPPAGGFNPDGFGGLIPTFEETTSDFATAISLIPAVSAVSSVANLPESLTCPVYTIPSTPFSGPIAMDIHCGVFNDYSGVISALFLFFWSATALFLFLRA